MKLKALVVCALMSVAASLFAQTDTATVIGAVTDQQQAALPGATVTARNVASGIVRTGLTDQAGRYRIAAVPPGTYEVSAELAGFTRAVRPDVRLALGAEAVLNFELGVASVAETVTVAGNAPIVETTTSAVSETLDRQSIDMLPLSGRDYTALLRLVPGAVANNTTYGFAGSRGRSNAWNIDGVDNSDEISGFQHQNPSRDSIQEVQVLVNGFKAEFGSASGGVVNVITRSGGNTMTGSGFFTFQDEALRARSPYANRALPEDTFQRVQYGATLGGPIRKDRTHYFFTYEREDRDTVSTSTRTLPAATANFSAATRQFLATHEVDLALFGAGGTVRHVRPEFVDMHKATARVDHQFNPSQYATFRYVLDSNDQPSGQSGTLLDYNGGLNYLRTNYANVNHKWVIGSTALNESFIQVGQHRERIDAVFNRLPRVTITGGFDLGTTSSFNPVDNWVYALNDTLTWTPVGGTHVVKAGAQVKILRSDSFFDSNFRGTFTFPSLAAFLAGTPSRYTVRQGDSELARPNQIYGFFVQDDWRPRPDLTINAGLRYDYESAKTEALRDVTGEAGPGIGRDKNNVSPRLGFAWSPGRDTRQAIYGGTGLYYDQVILNIIGNARFTPPKVIELQIDNPGFPDPFAGGAISVPPPSPNIIDPELVTPWNWNSQVGYRRELMANVGLDVSFVYNRGYDQIGIINNNAGAPGSASITGAGAVRPRTDVVNPSLYTNYGDIKYRGLLVDLTKRFANGIQGGLSYTLSKTENDSFNFVSTLQVPSQPDLSWGPDTNDHRHRLVTHVEARLPFDIQFGAIADFRTEAPLDVFANGRDLNGDGITGDWVNQSLCVARAGLAGGCPGFDYSRNSVRELSAEEANRLRSLFGLAPIPSFANNPKYFNVDVSLAKRIPFGRHAVRVTAEAFNVFNIAQRTAPNAQILSGNFGIYTAVEQPRALQLTLQYTF
jgi:hypothetical protein